MVFQHSYFSSHFLLTSKLFLIMRRCKWLLYFLSALHRGEKKKWNIFSMHHHRILKFCMSVRLVDSHMTVIWHKSCSWLFEPIEVNSTVPLVSLFHFSRLVNQNNVQKMRTWWPELQYLIQWNIQKYIYSANLTEYVNWSNKHNVIMCREIFLNLEHLRRE